MPASTAAGGIPELVKHQIKWLLVPVDEPMQIGGALIDAILGKPEKIHLGKAARTTVIDEFGMQQMMVRDLETIYTNF